MRLTFLSVSSTGAKCFSIASITGGRVKEITSAGSDCDIRYIYIHKDKNLNIKCIEQSAIIESFKQELPNIKIDSKSVDFSGALSLCS